MAELAQLPSSFVGAMSVAVTPPRQDGTPNLQSDAQNQGLNCLRDEMVTSDSKIKKRISPLQVRTVLEETLSELGPSGSLASFRTASTKLYLPPHSKDESPQNGCVSNFKNDLQNAPQTSPLQKVEDSTRGERRRPESTKRDHKRRKRSQTELATVDVEAAIASVVSVAEAIVVGQLMDASILSLGHDRSIIMEAALSIGKARQSCGLDRYVLSASTEDSNNFAMQDLDDKSMQEAYSDVGMIVEVLEDERQLLGVGPNVANLYQRNTKAGATVPYSTGKAGNFQLAKGTSTSQISDPAKLDGRKLENKVKEPPPSCTSVAVVSFDPEVKIGGIGAGNKVINVGDSQRGIEAPQEMDSAVMERKIVGVSAIEVIQSQGEVEAPEILVSTTSCRLECEPSELVGKTATKCIHLPTDTIIAMEEVSCMPEDKSEEKVAPEAELETKDMSPNSGMFCGDFLLRLDSVVEGIQDQAKHQEEVYVDDGIAIEVAIENKGTQSLESRELHPELLLPSKARAFPETKWSYPDAGKNPGITKDPRMVSPTANFVSPYVSRWFGGWSGDRANLEEITNPTVGEVKPAWFTVRSCISFIKPDQAMWYLACTSCNRKVSQEHSTSCWCEGCQKTYESCNRRYIMLAKLSDYSGKVWISAFNKQAEQILGQPAESLANVQTECMPPYLSFTLDLPRNPQDKVYEGVLKKASWVSRTSVVTVAPHKYQGEKRQRITVRSVGPVDWAAECKLVLEKIAARS